MTLQRSTSNKPSHSRVATLHDCERRFYHEYVEQLEPNEPSALKHMGGVLHVGFSSIYSGLSIDAVKEAAATEWGNARFHGDFSWVTLGHAQVVLHNYADYWKAHGDDWEVIQVTPPDRQLECVIDGNDFLITPDLVVRQSDGLRVVDHKTTSSYLGGKLYTRMKFGHQLRVYALGLQNVLQEPIVGGICNAVHMGEKAASASTKTKLYDRFGFDYTESDYEETRNWLRAGRHKEALLSERHIDDGGVFYAQNPSDRCSYCDFNKLCERPARLRPGIVKMHYRRRET